jgi:hypothetical protein
VKRAQADAWKPLSIPSPSGTLPFSRSTDTPCGSRVGDSYSQYRYEATLLGTIVARQRVRVANPRALGEPFMLDPANRAIDPRKKTGAELKLTRSATIPVAISRPVFGHFTITAPMKHPQFVAVSRISVVCDHFRTAMPRSHDCDANVRGRDKELIFETRRTGQHPSCIVQDELCGKGQVVRRRRCAVAL